MPSPFPGMDPYLENPALWSDVHLNLIAECQGRLSSQLRPKYVVKVEERVYISDESDEESGRHVRVPDIEVASRAGWESAPFSPGDQYSELGIPEPVIATTWFEEEVHEAYLTIIDRSSGDAIAIIEILSPANKVPKSAGRESFEQKRRQVYYSPTHWVEIDLLRGTRMVRVPRKAGAHQYLIHISRRTQRPRGQLWPIRLPQRLPVIPIPLKAGDPDGQLDLQAALNAAYDRANYDLRIDYCKEPKPPLDEKLASWADELLRSKGLR
jgi:Protein of unknown function (DUF4058)